VEKQERRLELSPATAADVEFAYGAWAEAVRPYVSPILEAKFDRRWNNVTERAGFDSWWRSDQSEIIRLDGAPVGWLASVADGQAITMTNFVIEKDYRNLGIATLVLVAKLGEWRYRFASVRHSVLKATGYERFFERFYFRPVAEDELAIILERKQPIKPDMK
jgi:hypothetical protein